MSAVVGLWAEDDALPPGTEEINRPLRTIRRDSLIPSPQSLIPSSSSALLTSENLDQPLTKHYIERYTSSTGVGWLNSVIANGGIYLPFVKEEIARRNLPPELAYLPFVDRDTSAQRGAGLARWGCGNL